MAFYERCSGEFNYHPNPQGGPEFHDGQLIRADTSIPVVHVHAPTENEARDRAARLLAGELGVSVKPESLFGHDLGEYMGDHGWLIGVEINRK